MATSATSSPASMSATLSPVSVQFPKTHPKRESLSSQATSTVAGSVDHEKRNSTTSAVQHRATRSDASATLSPSNSSPNSTSGAGGAALSRTHAHSQSLGSGTERGRTHTRLETHLHVRSVSPSRSRSHSCDHMQSASGSHLLSTSSLSVELDTAYHGPVIPPDSDRSAFLPPGMSLSTAQSLASQSYAAARAGKRGYLGRTLVLCFDGTGNQFDLDNSNVVNFFSVLRKGDHTRQLVYYQAGIGTYTIPQVTTPLRTKTSKLLDLMFATSLNHHVLSGYKFLMQECEWLSLIRFCFLCLVLLDLRTLMHRCRWRGGRSWSS